MRRIVTSPTEIVQVTKFGLWLAVGDEELWLDYNHYPWFRNATIQSICDVQEPSPGHFFWPALDIDLDIDTLRHPEDFPLVAQ